MRFLGHPVHPMLVAFPIGLLSLTPVWDALSWLGVMPEAAVVAYWTEIAGLVGGGLAALTGLVDFVALSSPAAVTVALRHATLAFSAISLFGVAFALRAHSGPATWLVLLLDSAGALCLAVAGWFGGHLVFHHGAAVEPGAEESRARTGGARAPHG